jgi:(p)ppGpp synthase/HD superfamily hydrolase
MTNQTHIVEKARIFARAAHAGVGQLRKYTNEPYIVHPMEVASLVGTVTHTDAMIAAALLHDVIEDTYVTQGVLNEEFGHEITELVMWLTKISKPQDGVRAVRKEMDRKFLAKAPAEAQTIKLADIVSNTSSIVQHDPVFAIIYLKEMALLLDVLTKGDKSLWQRAYRQL